uniref:Sterol carrier protein 2 n=1 Tax=Pristionchus pacificus TaxID=54126 RepID=A0A2A6CTM0_PRIPA|eukprot:PDM81383.1 daf-22.1b [Pristionchus pacificus]
MPTYKVDWNVMRGRGERMRRVRRFGWSAWNSQFQKEFSLDEVINARKIYDFMGLLECSPTSDGAAAAIICSENFLKKHPELRKQAVEIVGMKLGTDSPSVFKEDNMKMIGFDMIERISKELYKETGYGPNDVQVIELHDCFAPNELITYEAIGLCPVGKAGELIDRNDNTYGGKWVINPSGGLISKGHPIGATGVAQVPNAKLAMQHNIGIGGAGVVAMYKLADGAVSAAGAAPARAAPSGGALQSDAVMAEIKDRVTTEKELVKKAGQLVVRFIVTGANGQTKNWLVDLKQNPPFVGHNDSAKAELDVTLSDDTFMQMAAGKIKPDQARIWAFMKGQVKVKGNIAKAMKLQTILNPSMLKLKL